MNEDRIYDLEARFQVDEPARRDWRVLRPQSPIERLLARFGARSPQRFLLVGSRGTGKTTELQRSLELVDVSRHRAVFLDLARQFDEVVADAEAMERVEPWEVLLLVGLAVVYALEKLAHPEAQTCRHVLERATRPLVDGPSGPNGPALDAAFGAIGAATQVAGLAVASQVPGTGALVLAPSKVLLDYAKAVAGWGLGIGRLEAPRLEDQDPRARELLEAVNEALDRLRIGEHPPVVIIDGLDRVRSLDRIERLFVHSGLLGRLDAHLLCTAPLALARPRRGGASLVAPTTPRGFVIEPIPEVPILDREDPANPIRARAEGLAFFRELFAKRTADGDPVLTEAAVDRLAFAAGGRVREFVRLVNLTLFEALPSGSAGEAVVDAVLDRYRSTTLEMDLHRGHWDALQDLLDDEDRQLPDSDQALFLLATHRILPYLNGEPWYFPHPLLLRSKNLRSPS